VGGGLVCRSSGRGRPEGSEKLAGTDDKYRTRQGRYRVLYLIDDSTHTVTVVKVAHRREAYR
jgi:mRNA interferase RelE/StbE